MRAALALAALIAVMPAAQAGYSCPHGQILRVRLSQCVAVGSPLARAYAYAHIPRTLRARRRIDVVAPPVKEIEPESAHLPQMTKPTLTVPDSWTEDEARGIAIEKLRELLNK